jgi:hypothetical protein
VRRQIAVMMALIVGLAGCVDEAEVGDPTPNEERAYVGALMATSDDDEVGFSEDDKRCLAQATVRAIGVDRLKEHITPEEIRENSEFDATELGIELTEEDRVAFSDVVTACMDIRQFIVERMFQAEAQDLTNEEQECIDRELDDDLVRTMLFALVEYVVEGHEIQDDSDLIRDFAVIQLTCVGVPEAAG